MLVMRNRKTPIQLAPIHAIADVQKIIPDKASACFNFKMLWLQYTYVKVTDITSILLSILLEIEAFDVGQGKRDDYAAA